MKKKSLIILAMMVLITFMLAGCVPGDGSYEDGNDANFFSGVWHGWIAPVSLVLGLFNSTTRVYEVNNIGWWYDFGFYIAIISGFGGLSLSRRKFKDD